MKKKSGNPDFEYEIVCDQLCGKGHFSMRGIIIVETQKEYNAWMIKQRPEYRSAMAAINSSASEQTLALEQNKDQK